MQRLSVIIPIHNESGSIPELHRELTAMADGLPIPSEFIFVDDGSTDESAAMLSRLALSDRRVHLLVFRRNFGQTAAIAAGFDYAYGDVIATIDGDLQNPPSEIPALLAKLEEGYDLVAGWRRTREDRWLSRVLPSKIANWIISKSTKVALHDYGCTLKVFRAEVAKGIRLYGEMHRFIPALANQSGASICELPVAHRARRTGVSKYGFSRIFRVVLDIITVNFLLGFSTRPIHLFGGLGILSGLSGFAILLYLSLYKILYAADIGARPLLMLGVMLMLIGLQFLCFGLLAEVLVRTYHESQDKKTYAIKAVVHSDEDRSSRE